MDVLGLTDHAITLGVVAVLIVAIYQYGRRNFSFFKELGLSGPKPVSYLGNLIEMRKLGSGHAFKHWRKVYGDVYGMFLGIWPAFVVSDPEMVQEILIKKFSHFTNRGPSPFNDEISKLSVMAAQDEHWKYLRTILSPSYTSHQLREMNTMIHTCAQNLVENIDKLAENGEVTEVKKLFSAYTIDVIAATGFGITVNSQKNPDDPLVKNAKDLFKISFFTPIFLLALLFPYGPHIIKMFRLYKFLVGNEKYFRKFCKKLIERKKIQLDNGMHKNLLNLMIKAQVKGHETLPPEVEKELQLENITDWRTKRGIIDNEILAQCVLLFLAGYQTTATTLTFFAHLMALNPEQQEKLYHEIVDVLGEDLPTYDSVQKLPYLNMCMDETLRLFPIVNALDRFNSKKCTIKGVTIPAYVSVRISLDALHYNPKYWPEPEKFIPERFSDEMKSKQVPFTYLPFGGGPRMCLGMRLAKLEFKIAAVEMIRNFKILRTEKTEDPVVLEENITLSAKNGIWVKFERRLKK